MLAANNFPLLFDYLLPIVTKRLNSAQLQELINKQNNTGNTPIRTSFKIQTTL